MRTDCDKLLTHGIEVETMAVKCLLERPDVVDLHKGAKDLRFVVLMTEALGPLRVDGTTVLKFPFSGAGFRNTDCKSSQVTFTFTFICHLKSSLGCFCIGCLYRLCL
jgi:hypothetical protein